METIVLTQLHFDNLLEYSCSLPTGKTIGKQWKKNEFAYVNFTDGIKREKWYLMEYTEHPDPNLVGIKTKRIIAVLKLKSFKSKQNDKKNN